MMASGGTVDGKSFFYRWLATHSSPASSYQVHFVLFDRYGFGRATFSNGDTYEGMYINDKREGPGVYKWRDGRVYDGEFKE